MPIDISKLSYPITIFGNGEQPFHPTPLKILKNSGSILCADGGVNKLKKMGLIPNIILGDLDSLINDSLDCDIVKLNDQDKTDLQKSLNWCIKNGINRLSLVGFSGEDDDHWMAALWTLIHYYGKLNLVFYSNNAKIFCVNGKKDIETNSGQNVSIIPSENATKITIKNLKYSYKDQELLAPSFGIRNTALGSSFYIKTTKPVWVFLTYN